MNKKAETKCAICSSLSTTSRNGIPYCNKHYQQIYQHGMITDPSPSTKPKRVKNQIIEKENYAILRINKLGKIIDTIIDKEDIQRVSEHSWAAAIDGNLTYIYGPVNGKNQRLHRFLLGYTGEKAIDHINRNTLDNRKENLRIVTWAENNQNKNTKPEQDKRGGWLARFIFYGKRYYFGRYKTEEEAAHVIETKKKEFIENPSLAKEYQRDNPYKNIQQTLSGKWRVICTYNRRSVHVGVFETKEEAIKARDEFKHQKKLQKGA